MDNLEQEHHEMMLRTIDTSGMEEWYCPTCGRRFLLQWPPEYKKVVLDPGDEFAVHSGGKGLPGLDASEASASVMYGPADPVGESFEEPAQVNQESLQPWIEWLEKVDFESLWNRPSQ